MSDKKPGSLENQLMEVYAVIDELQTLENRLRDSIDTALSTLKTLGATDRDHE